MLRQLAIMAGLMRCDSAYFHTIGHIKGIKRSLSFVKGGYNREEQRDVGLSEIHVTAAHRRSRQLARTHDITSSVPTFTHEACHIIPVTLTALCITFKVTQDDREPSFMSYRPQAAGS